MFAFIEGFDDYPTNINSAGIGLASTWLDGSIWGALVGGRFGGRAFRKQYGESTYRGIPSTTQLTFGCAIYSMALASNSVNGNIVFRFGSTINSQQLVIGLDDLGNLKAALGSLATPIAIAPRRVLNQTWHYLEIEWVMADADGRLSLWLDGEKQFEFLGDTKGSASADIGRIQLYSNGGGATPAGVIWDDMYCKVDEAARIGECRAQLLTATDDVLAEWTRLSGPNNFEMIDEAQADGETTYNSSNEVGNRDLFNFGDVLGTPETIYAVQFSMAARKDDAGTRTVKHVLQIGEDEALSDEQYMSISYTWQRWIMPENPISEAPWEIEDVDAIVAGYELTL